MNTLIYSITPYRQNSLLEYFSRLVEGNNRGDAPMSVDDFIRELNFMYKEAPFPNSKLTWFHIEKYGHVEVMDNHVLQFKIDYEDKLHVPAFVENARNGVESGIVEHSKRILPRELTDEEFNKLSLGSFREDTKSITTRHTVSKDDAIFFGYKPADGV